ncbi:addiction module protein [Chryseosolibacter histidini]|uniref:addiction module protein n=1 Tax=Chryseosolibacter histidini TaxID=2782349 RepID=UPI0034DADF95
MSRIQVLKKSQRKKELTSDHKKVLDQRLREYKANPYDVLTWNEIKAKYSYQK